MKSLTLVATQGILFIVQWGLSFPSMVEIYKKTPVAVLYEMFRRCELK